MHIDQVTALMDMTEFETGQSVQAARSGGFTYTKTMLDSGVQSEARPGDSKLSNRAGLLVNTKSMLDGGAIAEHIQLTTVEGTVQWRYYGQLKDGAPHGKGIMVEHPKGARRYQGEFKWGRPHGRGVSTWTDGSRYEGEFQYGEEHGYGVITFVNGHRYEGEMRRGRLGPTGKCIWTDGARYEGEYKDGLRHGKGVYTWANGERFEGTFSNGKLLKPSAFVSHLFLDNGKPIRILFEDTPDRDTWVIKELQCDGKPLGPEESKAVLTKYPFAITKVAGANGDIIPRHKLSRFYLTEQLSFRLHHPTHNIVDYKSWKDFEQAVRQLRKGETRILELPEHAVCVARGKRLYLIDNGGLRHAQVDMVRAMGMEYVPLGSDGIGQPGTAGDCVPLAAMAYHHIAHQCKTTRSTVDNIVGKLRDKRTSLMKSFEGRQRNKPQKYSQWPPACVTRYGMGGIEGAPPPGPRRSR